MINIKKTENIIENNNNTIPRYCIKKEVRVFGFLVYKNMCSYPLLQNNVEEPEQRPIMGFQNGNGIILNTHDD